MRPDESKVLFLDMDGVLITRRSMQDKERRPVYMEDGHFTNALDLECVARLNRVVEQTNCTVVMSSTIRLLNSPGACTRYMRKQGCTFRIYDRTPGNYQLPDGKWAGRGDQIKLWLDEHPCRHERKIAIVDDEVSDMGEMLPFVVRTPQETGLQDEQADKLIAMLGGSNV